MGTGDKVTVGVIIGGIGLIASLCGLWGSKTYDIYTFQYKGEPSAIVRKDVRLGLDKYWISMGDEDKIWAGKLISDDGKLIKINNKTIFKKYSINDYNSSKE